MQTSKAFQILDEQNNNLSPITCIESVYVEVKEDNRIQRKRMYDKFVTDQVIQNTINTNKRITDLQNSSLGLVYDISFGTTYEIDGTGQSVVPLKGIKIERIPAWVFGGKIDSIKTDGTINYVDDSSHRDISLGVNLSTGKFLKKNAAGAIYFDETPITYGTVTSILGQSGIGVTSNTNSNGTKDYTISLNYNSNQFVVNSNTISLKDNVIGGHGTVQTINGTNGITATTPDNVQYTLGLNIDPGSANYLSIDDNKLVFTPDSDWGIKKGSVCTSINAGNGIRISKIDSNNGVWQVAATINPTFLEFDDSSRISVNSSKLSNNISTAVGAGPGINKSVNSDGTFKLGIEVGDYLYINQSNQLCVNRDSLNINSGTGGGETTIIQMNLTGGDGINVTGTTDKTVSLKLKGDSYLKLDNNGLYFDDSHLPTTGGSTGGEGTLTGVPIKNYKPSTNSVMYFLFAPSSQRPAINTTDATKDADYICTHENDAFYFKGGFGLGLNSSTTIYGMLDVNGIAKADEFYLKSDKRYKTEIDDVSIVEPLNIKSFKWIDSSVQSYGFIAQELEVEHPEFVLTGDDGYKHVNYNAALSYTIAALINKVNMLEEEIKNLKNN